MSYEWLFRLNINLFIIIYTCCSAEEMASVPRRHTGAEIGNQKIWLIPPGLFPLYRRKCKFNYLFVHVSSPKVRQHNLNGNGETIYFLTWLFLPQIQAVTVEMKLVNKSQLFNHCVPIITVNNKWWGEINYILWPFCLLPWNHFSTFLWITEHFWLFRGEKRARKHKGDDRLESASPASPAGSSTLTICFDFRASSSVPLTRLSMKGKENFDAPLCNLHWAEVNCFRFG